MQGLTPHNETAENSGSPRQPTPGNERVFISYARENEAFVLRLASALKSRGIPVWLDQWDIPPGADWDRAIDQALRESRKVVAVLSPEAVASPQVRGEIQSAVNERKAVFPVLYRDCEVPRILKLYQFSDFKEPRNFEPELSRLAEALGARTSPHVTKQPPKPHSWRNFVTQLVRLMPSPIAGAAVIAAILVLLSAGYFIDRSFQPISEVNPEERKPAPRPLERTGNLQVSVNVDEARVSLDGAEVGVARHAVPLILRGLSAGEHQLRIEAPGYVPEERRIIIVADDWTSEGVALRQSAPMGQ